MPSVDPGRLTGYAMGGGFAALGTCAFAAGDTRAALLLVVLGLAVGFLVRPILGLVLLGVLSPLIPIGFTMPGGSTVCYWPVIIVPALVPGIAATLLLRRAVLRPLDAAVLALVAAAAVSLLVSGFMHEGLYGLAIFGMVAVACLAATLQKFSGRDAAYLTTLIWAAGLLEAAAVTVSFMATGAPLDRYVMHQGTLSHGFLASFLIITAAIGTSRLSSRSGPERLLGVTGLLLSGYALLIVSARAGIAGAAVAVTTTVLLVRPRLLVAGVALLGLVVLWAIVAGFAFIPFIEHALYISSAAQIEETLTRAQLAGEAWSILLQKPVLGVGPGNYAAVGQFVNYLGQPIQTPHDNYLQVAAETGFVGLTLFVLVLWLGLREALLLSRKAEHSEDRQLGAATAGALIGMALQSLAGDFLIPAISNNGLDGVRSAVVLWTLVGLVSSRNRTGASGRDGIRPSVPSPSG